MAINSEFRNYMHRILDDLTANGTIIKEVEIHHHSGCNGINGICTCKPSFIVIKDDDSVILYSASPKIKNMMANRDKMDIVN